MKLNNLMKDIDCQLLKGDIAVEINDITCDSRNVSQGDLFVCISGMKSDGHNYIKDAVTSGAAAIIIEKVLTPSEIPDGVSVLSVKSSRKVMANLARVRFANPASKLTTIAITGTKGKTTTAYMVKSILDKAGKKAGMIGTTGVFYGDVSYRIENTTPDAYELNRIMAQMVEAGCEYLVMEASSQSVKMDRIEGMNFDYGIFTNLSPDHIGPGEHESMEEYIACKKKILNQSNVAIINADDELYEEMCDGCNKVVPYSADNEEYDFNVYNAKAATVVCKLLGIKDKYIEQGLQAVYVPGRMEIVYRSDELTIVIDFAHNGSSVENVLKALRKNCSGRLIAIFGAGGNRSHQRRIGMGEAAGKLADLCIITTDNPRWEKLSEINEGIIEGVVSSNGQYLEIDDRYEAIQYAVDISRKGDVIAVLGKGHEKYIEIEGVKHYYSEHEAIRKALENKTSLQVD